jgi:hypothetical protein
MKPTPIGHLPGVSCAAFDHGKVLCRWEGGLDDTLLHFYGVGAGGCRLLASLGFDFFVSDLKEAQAMASAAWSQFREQSLSGDGSRLYVIEEGNTIRLTAADAEKVFNAIENPPAPNEKLLAAVRDYRERWFKENKGAIDDYNEHIKKNGVFGSRKRRF